MSVWQAKLFNQSALIVVPRTRSPHDFSTGTVANFGFKSGTRIIDLLVSSSIPKFAQRSPRVTANFGIGTLAHMPAEWPPAANARWKQRKKLRARPVRAM